MRSLFNNLPLRASASGRTQAGVAIDWQYLMDFYVDPRADSVTTNTTFKAENHAVQLSGFFHGQ